VSGAPYARFQPKSRREWRAWLRRNHAKCAGLWLVMAKKASGLPSLAYAEAVEEALCFGWIDGRANPVDAQRWCQLFTPRRAGSGWSKLNKARVASLEATGAMAAPGRAKIAAAKADGSWSKLDAVEAFEMPPDLARALKARRGATATFAAFSPSSRKGILGWIAQAKRPATRLARVTQAADMAARGLRARFDTA
jgi:uncharacterized protein YdeI (YjbR/CyaY-like superfamily)